MGSPVKSFMVDNGRQPNAVPNCFFVFSTITSSVQFVTVPTVFITLELLCFVYLGFYVAFNTVQVISRRVVGRAEETST